jgi:hypothetical protein
MIRTFQRAWDRFWFTALPLGDVAVLRIVWAGALLAYFLWSDLTHSIARFEGPDADGYEPIPLLRFLALPFGGAGALTRGKLEVALVATQVAGALAVAGLRTRWSLLAFAAGSLLLQSWFYSTHPLSHHVALLEWSILLLAFSPCGEVLSVDAWLARRSGRAGGRRAGDLVLGAAWPARTVHALLALAYLSAAATKVLRGPEEWFSGWTLHYYVSFQAIRTDSAVAWWLSERHVWILAIAWVVIAFEVGFALSIFQRRARWIWALACMLVHAGAAVFMGVVFPSFPILCAGLIPWTDAARRIARRASP